MKTWQGWISCNSEDGGVHFIPRGAWRRESSPFKFPFGAQVRRHGRPRPGHVELEELVSEAFVSGCAPWVADF